MGQFFETNHRNYLNGGTALSAYLRVVETAGVLALAGATDREHGVTTRRIEASQFGSVHLRTANGTVCFTASAAITAGALVYGAASGKISATANANLIGIALQAASGDGSVIEVLRLAQINAYNVGVTDAKTADYTVLAADSGKTFSTAGAAGTVTFAMPAATVGLKYRFRVGAAQELRIDPDGTETISLPSTGVPGAAGKYLTANAAGETVDIECVVAGTWSVFGYTGTWTAEP